MNSYKKLAQEITAKLRSKITIDWQHKASVRAEMILLVRRILRRYKYPPDKQEQAVELVLKQAEALADAWTTA